MAGPGAGVQPSGQAVVNADQSAPLGRVPSREKRRNQFVGQSLQDLRPS